MIDLEALGITKEELQRRVVERITLLVMTKEMTREDEDGEPYSFAGDSNIAETLNAHVKEEIDRKVTELADKFVVPQVGTLIENFTLQKTNDWGEKRGESITFIEYLVQRADAYLREPVSYEGKPKGTDGYSWKQSGTRVEYMIDKHLNYHISQAMSAALNNVNSSIAKGLEEGVKVKLAELLARLKVTAKVDR